MEHIAGRDWGNAFTSLEDARVECDKWTLCVGVSLQKGRYAPRPGFKPEGSGASEKCSQQDKDRKVCVDAPSGYRKSTLVGQPGLAAFICKTADPKTTPKPATPFKMTNALLEQAANAWCADAKAAAAKYGGIDTWDTTGVKTMKDLFKHKANFNVDINSWKTSAVVDMSSMFYGASFNQNIDSWQTDSVTDMHSMFALGGVFNQNINSWQTGNVIDMSHLFVGVCDKYGNNCQSRFNQPLNSWQTSSVASMAYMFRWASDFSQPLNCGRQTRSRKWRTCSSKQRALISP